MRLYIGSSLFSEWAQTALRASQAEQVSMMEDALKDRLYPAKALLRDVRKPWSWCC